MSENIGKIGWIDMTVEDASGLRDFYQKVVGWIVEDTSMGDYSDYTMMSPDDGDAIAGVCHARGSNADLPGGCGLSTLPWPTLWPARRLVLPMVASWLSNLAVWLVARSVSLKIPAALRPLSINLDAVVNLAISI